MTDEQRYVQAWRDRQWRRIAAVIVVILVFLYVLVFNQIWPVPRSDQMRGMFFAGLMVWAVLAVAAIARILTFKCPRCGKLFNLSASMRSYKAKTRTSCIHCHLPIGALPGNHQVRADGRQKPGTLRRGDECKIVEN
jgi:hypothetical protein